MVDDGVIVKNPRCNRSNRSRNWRNGSIYSDNVWYRELRPNYQHS